MDHKAERSNPYATHSSATVATIPVVSESGRPLSTFDELLVEKAEPGDEFFCIAREDSMYDEWHILRVMGCLTNKEPRKVSPTKEELVEAGYRGAVLHTGLVIWYC